MLMTKKVTPLNRTSILKTTAAVIAIAQFGLGLGYLLAPAAFNGMLGLRLRPGPPGPSRYSVPGSSRSASACCSSCTTRSPTAGGSRR